MYIYIGIDSISGTYGSIAYFSSLYMNEAASIE